MFGHTETDSTVSARDDLITDKVDQWWGADIQIRFRNSFFMLLSGKMTGKKQWKNEMSKIERWC